ncbi:MAG: helix-turn-helix transcriptional regulator [Kordiimonadaceae bacterium]|nr:helix-turn-helix transcriptional regulator [Kordiimonadaceae bacterium]
MSASQGDKTEESAAKRLTWDQPCPIERGMRVIGGKWKGTILWHLKDGPVRFNALTRKLQGASKKMITQRLKELEAAGLITRTVICTKPFAVTYETTEEGRGTLHILEALKVWAEEQGV